jgi:hypothetical protein
MSRFEATLARVLKLLVAVARRGEASIVGGDLRAPAALSFQLGRLWRDEVKLGGQAESVRRGEEIGVKGVCSGCPYL